MKNPDERFSFTPPPMVAAEGKKKFEATMSVSDIPMMEAQTCSSLMSKMVDVLSAKSNYSAEECYSDSDSDFDAETEFDRSAEFTNDSLFAPPQMLPSQAPLQFAEEAPFLFSSPAPQLNTTAPAAELDVTEAQLSFEQEIAQIYAAHADSAVHQQEVQRQTTPNYVAPISSFSAKDKTDGFKIESVAAIAHIPETAQVTGISYASEAVAEEEAEIVTVVDFTAMAKSAVKKTKQTFSGLASLARHGGLTKAPVNQNIASSWFA